MLSCSLSYKHDLCDAVSSERGETLDTNLCERDQEATEGVDVMLLLEHCEVSVGLGN